MVSKKVKNKENVSYILPSTNEDLQTFVEKNKIDMMEQVVSSIEFALKNKLPMIEVFQFKGSRFVITISEKEFEANLSNVYCFYMKDEIYELCNRVLKVQELLKRKNNEKEKST
jgi:hypothetical protein